MFIDTYLRLLGADPAASLTLSDLGILVGILTGLLSALVNLVYTWRKDRREQRASDAAWIREQKEASGDDAHRPGRPPVE
ncbi:hypothetical protein [Telluria beijingensis]|uniref:hypothetical protein n=1 Tax=Telluria beijingensis TaxID=3068633 RepID=UPI002795CF74|nr:hypothetical protein [Massilia sp. REN29]